ncbi:hypothetical protein [Planomicrobium okeanokoites]|uniref:hypothetical protein n=1 Tax=Planomicrobium okeanokoites TaxID=244 RepID=UPI000A05176F|nr:hypothetical protein [Planomicrobium okeanokoites]
MVKTKIGMVVGSIVGVFILVYGTAFLFHLLFGGYMLEGGLVNLNYGVLALLCAAPFVLKALMGRSNCSKGYAILMSAALFSVLFVLVHLVMVLSGEGMQDDAVMRILVVFPLSALLLVVTLHFTSRKENIS